MEGNNKAMREALGLIRAELHNNTIIARKLKYRLFDIADSALSKPPRNCDMGTASEQAKRLNEWCDGRHCVNCQFKGGWPDECKLQWSQMPYEEGGAK